MPLFRNTGRRARNDASGRYRKLDFSGVGDLATAAASIFATTQAEERQDEVNANLKKEIAQRERERRTNLLLGLAQINLARQSLNPPAAVAPRGGLSGLTDSENALPLILLAAGAVLLFFVLK